MADPFRKYSPTDLPNKNTLVNIGFIYIFHILLRQGIILERLKTSTYKFQGLFHCSKDENHKK